MTTPRTVKAWAEEIRRRLPDHSVRVYEGSYTPFRKPKGLRYRTWEGKTRYAAALEVWDRTGRSVYRFNRAETYRTLKDVADWLQRYERELHHPAPEV